MTHQICVFKTVQKGHMEIFQQENVFIYARYQMTLLQMIVLGYVNKNVNRLDFMLINLQESVLNNVHQFQHYMESYLKKYVLVNVILINMQVTKQENAR